MTPEERLRELKLELPTPPKPVASYVPWTRSGQLIFVSGQIPTRDGKVVYAGKVGADLSLEEGQQAARLCALNGMAVAAAGAGGLYRIRRIVRVGVFVNSAPGFTDQPKVGNGASDLLVDVFGEAGRHARAAVGVNELPLNAAVEVELIVEV
jgi:enamine deaminase RidA (YjgF/YER057c/UK114 family)